MRNVTPYVPGPSEPLLHILGMLHKICQKEFADPLCRKYGGNVSEYLDDGEWITTLKRDTTRRLNLHVGVLIWSSNYIRRGTHAPVFVGSALMGCLTYFKVGLPCY